MKNILFVCTGNTCRSPLAEAMLKEKAAGELEVRSAGIHAAPGMQASAHTVKVLEERSIPLHHFSRPLTQELIDWADLVLTMTKSHHNVAVQQYPAAADKIFTINEFADIPGDIQDPIGGSIDMYRTTAEEIERAIEVLLENVRKA
ncbi:low molecular weight protein arginine phosphatase [Alteribacillus sp. HJP-4]|uniref:low molecular weight protein arginine phosphatase n=1 Tax=Alteribacillus sp. HJP-4 TaxID=2775394 RepID=UPI0035CD293D